MLSKELVRVRGDGAVVAPAYLTGRDEVWIREVLHEIEAMIGRTAAEIDDELDARLAAVLDAHRVARITYHGVRSVVMRSYRSRTRSALDPRAARVATFERAAARRHVASRDEVLAEVAAGLGTTPELLAASLFADRPRSRILERATPAPSACEIVERYNLALLQGLLARAERLVVRVRAHVRAVVRFAKLSRLMCAYAVDAEGTSIEITGPLSLFRDTLKYGRSLASFVPALMTTPAWSLAATCVLGPRGRVLVHAAAGDPIASTHVLPRDYDSNVERALARDVRRIAGPWRIERETAALDDGGTTFFPDFTLVHEGGVRVHVEIVGFYTADYLARKAQALTACQHVPLIACIDASLSCGAVESSLPAERVLRYRRRVDALALLRMADVLVRRGHDASDAKASVGHRSTSVSAT